MCVCVCVCVFFHMFHSFVYKHLSCYHVLAIINNAQMNMGVWIQLQNSGFISFRYMPELLDLYSSFIFKFFRKTNFSLILFSTVAAPIYFPINSVQGFPFLYLPL